MVNYSKWVQIVWEIIDDDLDVNAIDVIEIIAEIWNDRKGEIEAANEDEARSIARAEIVIE